MTIPLDVPRHEGHADLPVAVVGAGPGGQTAALALARWGLDVRFFDKRAERDPIGSKAICQARDVLDVWGSLGAGTVLADEGVTWTTARTYYRGREIDSWRFADSGRSPYPPFVNISQQRTEEVLDDCLARLGVRCRWGVRIEEVTQDAAGVTLRIDGEPQRFSHAVFATGARGVIREVLGLAFEGRTFDDAFLICDIEATLPGWETERRFHFDPEWNPGRQVLIHACPGSQYRIDWQVPEDYDLVEDERTGGLDRRIRQIIGEHTPYRIVWKSVYRFQSRHVEQMAVGRILLAGDVAHLVAPFGARGLNTGVLDADNLGWKIAFDAYGWGGPGLIDSYSVERVAAARENAEVVDATMAVLVPQDDAARARRTALLEAAASGSGAPIDSGRFAEPFWYVDSPLTTPDESRPFAGRPPKGTVPPPGPGIMLPDVRLADGSRLRDAARLAITVIGPREVATDVRCPVAHIPATGLGDEARTALGYRDGEWWVLRPDCYVAGIATAPGQVAPVIRKTLGF
ncbi:FAD-dependent monooxygenase [Cumulibacter manganitolerans]|uniref:FAD-dependent monooxygenase n=1 Tax=Cumulibacter manganitolerans TaxID=1884992 RepID=UPI001294CE85|nr:FAD-dependent monooxygenase [Cumulibacter manganitolerans]